MYPLLQDRIRAHGVWIVLVLLCLVLQLLGLKDSLRFDRELIAGGEFWLLVSGHLLHLNWSHFMLNMAGVLLVAVFFNSCYRPLQWLVFLVFSALFTGLALFALTPDLQGYVGMSGVLHGLFILGAWQESKVHALSGWVLFALVIAKLAYEQVFGALPGSESLSGGKVAVDAHLYGAVSGLMFVALNCLFDRSTASDRSYR